ncbi:MAG: hypothetical protein ACLFUS_13005 [Candidatus Sumerlaeia bacterium]
MPEREDQIMTSLSSGDAYVETLVLVGASVVLAISLAFLIYSLMRRKLEVQRREEEKAAKRFEQSMMRSMGYESGTISEKDSVIDVEPEDLEQEKKAEPKTVAETGPKSESPPPSSEADSANEKINPKDPDQAMETVIRRLNIAGILEGSEMLHLEGADEPGRYLRLRMGKQGILFPPGAPSSAYLRHVATVDYVFLIEDNGTVLVCRSLSDYIADSVFKG